MRQIDYNTGYALRDFQEGYLSSNTAIKKENGVFIVYLFGNPIAQYDGNRLFIDTCGFYTLTTVNRLNGILNAIAPGKTTRKGGKFYLYGKEWNGEKVNPEAFFDK